MGIGETSAVKIKESIDNLTYQNGGRLHQYNTSTIILPNKIILREKKVSKRLTVNHKQ